MKKVIILLLWEIPQSEVVAKKSTAWKKAEKKKSENFSFRFFLCLPKCGEFLAFYVEDFFDEWYEM